MTLGMSRAEAAKALGVGTRLLDELIANGEVRAVHVGRRVVVPATELQGYLDRKLASEKPSAGAA